MRKLTLLITLLSSLSAFASFSESIDTEIVNEIITEYSEESCFLQLDPQNTTTSDLGRCLVEGQKKLKELRNDGTGSFSKDLESL